MAFARSIREIGSPAFAFCSNSPTVGVCGVLLMMLLSQIRDNGIINNGPKQSTVADLEAQVKAGFSISLTELAAASHREQKKPSVLEKLREKTPEQTKNKTAPKRSAEREL